MPENAAVNCDDVKQILERIWHMFRTEGIADDLQIIEHVGAMLLTHYVGAWDRVEERLRQDGAVPLRDIYRILSDRFQPPDQDLLPALPSGMPAGKWHSIGEGLLIALRLHKAGPLYDSCIVPRLPDMLAGGRYPTPRHIATLMLDLVGLRRGETLADLACGSGGLLVAASDLGPWVTGVEISPNWARIAYANAVLHDLPKPNIRIGNTFNVFRDPEHTPRFDRILVNPPFGETIDRGLVEDSFERFRSVPTTSRSETLFTVKALDLLSEKGSLAVLLPSSPLFTGGGYEQQMREQWVQRGQLRAVISLPKDAFQPYSNSQTHLLIVRKAESDAPPDGVWFYQVSHDGFTGGRNRRPAPEKSELPALVAALQGQDASTEPEMRVSDRLLGRKAPLKELAAKDFDLRPSSYWPAEAGEHETRSAAEILGAVKLNQQAFGKHLDYLLGFVELTPLAQGRIPARVAPGEPFGTLNDLQAAVWHRIRGFVETFTPEDAPPYETAYPFRGEDVSEGPPPPDAQRALDLFERMGLIVKVSIEGAPYYRRITERDVPEAGGAG